MTTTYRLHPSELSVELIESIKVLFKDTIEIVVSDESFQYEPDAFKRYAIDDDPFEFWMAEDEQDYKFAGNNY